MATAKKSQKKNCEKLNEFNFSRQIRRLCRSCSHHRAPATRQFQEKIASPSQAKNRSCSRGLKLCFAPPHLHATCRRPMLPWTSLLYSGIALGILGGMDPQCQSISKFWKDFHTASYMYINYTVHASLPYSPCSKL